LEITKLTFNPQLILFVPLRSPVVLSLTVLGLQSLPKPMQQLEH
jgi:hypothetical protein